MNGRLGQDAPIRAVQGVSVRPNGVVLKLFCGHQRFLGGIDTYSAGNWRCLSCVPQQNDMGRERSW